MSVWEEVSGGRGEGVRGVVMTKPPRSEQVDLRLLVGWSLSGMTNDKTSEVLNIEANGRGWQQTSEVFRWLIYG